MGPRRPYSQEVMGVKLLHCLISCAIILARMLRKAGRRREDVNNRRKNSFVVIWGPFR